MYHRSEAEDNGEQAEHKRDKQEAAEDAVEGEGKSKRKENKNLKGI